MTYLSDTLTIGLVIILLFGSIVLYLYTCIQQSEQKISLLESILLDIKMSGEIKSYSELPADDHVHDSQTVTPSVAVVPVEVKEVKDESTEAYTPFEESSDDTVVDIENLEPIKEEHVDYHSVIADAVEETESNSSVSDKSTQYESMTLKELQSLAKSRGITGAGSMKKNSIIEALKTSDRIVKPGSVGSNSFLESSAMVSGDESA